jgi:hypothetical protein
LHFQNKTISAPVAVYKEASSPHVAVFEVQPATATTTATTTTQRAVPTPQAKGQKGKRRRREEEEGEEEATPKLSSKMVS